MNVGAVVEYREVSERYQFLKGQMEDVEQSKRELLELIQDLTRHMRQQFTQRFGQINENFGHIFRELFGGVMQPLIGRPMGRRDLLRGQIAGHRCGTGGLGGLVIPAFEIQHFQRLLQVLYFLPDGFPLPQKQLIAAFDGGVALHGHIDVGPDVFDRHAGLLQAFDQSQPFIIPLLKDPYAAGRALYKRQ